MQNTIGAPRNIKRGAPSEKKYHETTRDIITKPNPPVTHINFIIQDRRTGGSTSNQDNSTNM